PLLSHFTSILDDEISESPKPRQSLFLWRTVFTSLLPPPTSETTTGPTLFSG
ncbi:hypothetical protein CMV_023529, partial [Castanea mollissima]